MSPKQWSVCMSCAALNCTYAVHGCWLACLLVSLCSGAVLKRKMQDCGPRHTYVCIHAQLHTLLAYSIRAMSFQCRLASKSSDMNVTSTQSIRQTGNFSLPWRLSQPPESSAGQSAVDHLSEGPGHLSLQAAAAGLE